MAESKEYDCVPTTELQADGVEAPLTDTEEVVPEAPTGHKAESSAVGSSKAESQASSGTAATRRLVKRESVKTYVNALKPFALTFQDLSVYVPREKGCCSKMSAFGCCFYPIRNAMVENMGWAVEQKDPYYALKETTGYVENGQMVLTLTPDTQYASALIQTITGRLSDKYEVVGSIRVNGTPIPTKVQQGWRRIAAHVSSDDGTHAAVLTVRETLRFAAECTTSAEEGDDKIDEMVNEVLEILDLTSCADTVVGDENLRGVSGGQKRRVTVGEMLVARGTRFLGLENITDGLSSQDSYKIIKEIKAACDSFNSAAVISLNQPSDEIVELFDHILVMTDEGELAYFGPPDRTKLEEIFRIEKERGGGSSNTAMSICDLCLSPMTDEGAAEEIKDRFLDSSVNEDMYKGLRALHNKKSFKATIQDLLPKTKYASGMSHNFKILGKRRILLITRNPSTYFRIGTAIFFGMVVGSLFSVLNQDVPSSLARTAYMFQNLFLVLLLSTGVTVPQNIRDRITFFKHRSSEFYSGRVYYLCQIIFELPLSIIEAILLSITSYFWVGMNPTPSRFFFYMAVMIAMEFVGLALGRLFCAISRTQVVAKSVVSVATLLFSTVSGFMPKYNQIPDIFVWLSWLSPPAYGFEALAINEYVGRELSGITLSDGGTDTSVGVVPGEAWLDTLQLPRIPWTDLEGIKAFNIIFLFVLAIAFDLLGFALMERARRNFFSQLRRPQRFSKSLSFIQDQGKGGVPDPPRWPSSLTISNLSYYVPLKGASSAKRLTFDSVFGSLLLGKKKGSLEVSKTKETTELQLLTNVTATFGAGRATALMGTSGAGKTTLLDVIAGYKTGGRITGDLTLNGVCKDKQIWTLLAGYAEQNDIINPYLTVLETLKFTASCRLPASMNRAAIIDNVIGLMSLEDWTDYLVGVENEGEGIPKHVRKRLTIAIQLVMLPKILFLDEPTTGLGTAAANLVMDAIRRSTTEMNLITVATIHQPSKLIWDAFDDLLLLARGGKVAYTGEMGPKSEKVIGYFSRLAATPMLENSNPADYVIASVSSVTPDDAQSTFANSKECEEVALKLKEESSLTEEEKKAAADLMQKAKVELGKRKSFLRELAILTKRMLIIQWRNPSYSMTRIVCSVLLAIYFGILFGGDKSTIEGAVLSIGSTFFLVFVLVVPMQAAVVPLIADRAVLYREATSGLYSRLSYAIASLLADIPFHALNCVLMWAGFYFLIGFQTTDDRMGYFIVMIFFCNWAFTSIGEVYAITTPNEEAANGLAGLTTILSVLFMGFLIKAADMPVYWQWANTADILRYVIQGLTSNELGDNHYKLFPDDAMTNVTLFGDIGNATDLFFFPPQTDVSPGSDANQAGNLLNLFLQSSPAGTADWNSSFVGVLEKFIDCGMMNECFVQPIATAFTGCFALGFPRPAPCGDEFEALAGAVKGSSGKAIQCLSGPGGRTDDRTIASTDEFDALSVSEQDRALVCLVNSVLPAGLLKDMIKHVTGIVERLTGIGTVVVNVLEVLENGLPGEVILFVFGWAEIQDGELVAPYKWYYCLFAVSMFVLGIEFFKLIGTQFIVWTNR